jgi:hypothetical protein
MRPGVIEQGEGAGKRRATVERWPTYGALGVTWLASHEECGWCDELTAWHNAFWAADHHVRYDCGKREPSSGHIWYDGYPVDRPQYLTTAELYSLNEGGMQNDPHPSDNGDPLPPACAEDATVELGCITTELGVQVDGDSYARGGAQAGEHGGSRGWWPWGSGHGR